MNNISNDRKVEESSDRKVEESNDRKVEDVLKGSSTDWRHWLDSRLPLYGHRNWIVVADSAYPAQSRSGIETIVANESQTAILEQLFEKLRGSSHVRPIIHVDRELAYVREQDAPGVGEYRDWLSHALGSIKVTSMPHEDIIARLDVAAQTFRVAIIKSTMTIPYTTVFIELDCAYWDAESEARMRSAMQE